MTSDFLSTPIKFLKGVGPEREKILKSELGISTYEDLLNHFPFRYIDRTKFYKVRELNENLPYVQLRGKITQVQLITQGKRRLVAAFEDEEGKKIELVWFQGLKWIQTKLQSNVEYIVFGKPQKFLSTFSIVHPEIDEATEENIKLARKLQPVYSSTSKLESKWLGSNGIWKLQRTLISQINNSIPETLSEEILKKNNLISREEAYKIIHLPDTPELMEKAVFRLKFEELFFIQLSMLQMKALRKKKYAGFCFRIIGNYFRDFYNHHLPFELTDAQKRVIKEIRTDMASGKQMNRLLQGDVGSGKTIVALLCMLIAIDNGFQTCIMAPTEILAQQHFKNFSTLLEKINLNVKLLSGSTKQKERKQIHEQLQSGELKIIVGTHALLEEDVKFRNLGLAIIDEQHKFGVAQRSRLWKKSKHENTSFTLPHILIMTATPIPRTLAMTLYGDLDVSVINELPPGRKPVKTYHSYNTLRPRVFQFMRQQIEKGRQIYVVFPMIEESEKLDYEFLMEGYERIRNEFPSPKYITGIVHGQMKNELREAQMKHFAEGKMHILVATTVIEVGVDVPNATVMVIESAERFGLSQLHQLRGRVGRGADESYCILLTGNNLSSEAQTRIQTMCRTHNGFEIAEVDMQLRGPGDIAGTRQSGLIETKIADIVKDSHTLHLARTVAGKILQSDPELSKPENGRILDRLNQIKREKTYWGRIS